MVTNHLRRDPVTGEWVVIDPASLVELTGARDVARPDPAPCAFCEGHEAEAGGEVLAWRDGTPANGPGWSVRVVPSRHPVLRIEAAAERRVDGGYESQDGLGAHEVVIETPRHDEALQALPDESIWRVLWAWRTRMQDLARDARFAALLAFKNHGRAAGARMAHSHSQVMAYPFVPPALAARVDGAAAHFASTSRCIYCDVVERERRERTRLVAESDLVVTVAPYASRAPFQVCLLPARHDERFEDAPDEVLRAVAAALGDVLRRIDWALGGPAYQIVLRSAPVRADAAASFHWHLDVTPRVAPAGGLEWSSGIARNPVSPEQAAGILRGAPID